MPPKPRLPPPLKPVPKEDDSVDKLGVQISDNGTLQIDLDDGKHLQVRSWGTAEEGQKAANKDEDTPSSAGLIGSKIKWDELKMGHVIGEGSQAKVRKVKHTKTGIIYALKIITLGKSVTKKQIQSEMSRVLCNAHPNIVRSEEAFYIDGALKILMEYMDLGTLASIQATVGCIPGDILAGITRQMLSGLHTLHCGDIVHRDIKPSNILVNSHGIVKISDFGVSTVVNTVNPFAHTMVGSTAYMSPERVRAAPYDATSDVWSIGLSVAQCALGVFPFYVETDVEPGANPFAKRPNMFDLATMIAESRAKIDFDDVLPKVRQFYPDRANLELSPELRDFIQLALRQDPKERPRCDKLLEHPYITKHANVDDAAIKTWLKSASVGSKKDKG
eukprot:NODE_1301_length_1388_cov_77.002379_g1290_i0.p1 GENE.NODE_1301_length_1388_cov_77.002379_g1290_i0~~NODE_1301_length_1388_cov_77.002379_g1290_i0.p1  ORF type:complete len:389 (+),score=60.06 NODE_1301_length_1388_cov_77.002379_g1290_i0:112-1278(+)